jgi:hypothetical protein
MYNAASKADAQEPARMMLPPGRAGKLAFRMHNETIMVTRTVLSSPVSSKVVEQPLPVEQALSVLAANLSSSTQKTPAAPTAKSAPKATLWRDLFSFAVDALDLRSWRDMNPTACILLAGFMAVVSEPLVHGGLAGRFLALMTSMK